MTVLDIVAVVVFVVLVVVAGLVVAVAFGGGYLLARLPVTFDGLRR